MFAEEGDSFPDHDPPCTGDNETKCALVLGRMVGPIAFCPVTDTLHMCHSCGPVTSSKERR